MLPPSRLLVPHSPRSGACSLSGGGDGNKLAVVVKEHEVVAAAMVVTRPQPPPQPPLCCALQPLPNPRSERGHEAARGGDARSSSTSASKQASSGVEEPGR